MLRLHDADHLRRNKATTAGRLRVDRQPQSKYFTAETVCPNAVEDHHPATNGYQVSNKKRA